MDMVGLWKIDEMNVMNMDFEQTWRKVSEIGSDPEVPMMQKMMARAEFLFEQDGTFLQLLPKDMAGEGGEAYGEDRVIGHRGKWKEEDGKVLAATESSGEDEWSEAVPTENGFEVFGFCRIVRA